MIRCILVVFFASLPRPTVLHKSCFTASYLADQRTLNVFTRNTAKITASDLPCKTVKIANLATVQPHSGAHGVVAGPRLNATDGSTQKAAGKICMSSFYKYRPQKHNRGGFPQAPRGYVSPIKTPVRPRKKTNARPKIKHKTFGISSPDAHHHILGRNTWLRTSRTYMFPSIRRSRKTFYSVVC
jgi:hypothetical protein